MPSMDFEGFRVTVSFQGPGMTKNNGACLCVQVGPEECYLLGNACGISFQSLREERPNLDLLLVEEGAFKDGQWTPGRRLNGDETAHLSLEKPSVLHVKFFTYC